MGVVIGKNINEEINLKEMDGVLEKKCPLMRISTRHL